MAIIQKKDLFTPTAVQTELFSDFLNDLVIHPVKKDVVKVVNEDAVKRSIRNILLTNTNERLYNPTFGSQLISLLFEPFSETTKASVQKIVRSAIENHEPRAKVEAVRVEGDLDTNTLLVTINFSIINKEEPVTLELLLNRIR